MKVLFILSAMFIGLAFTTFTPKWADCGSTNGWITKNVTLNKYPAPSENVTFEICGENTSVDWMSFTDLKVTVADYLNETIFEPFNVGMGQDHCLSYDTEIPSAPIDPLRYVFQLQADIFGWVGCVQVTAYF